MPASGTHNLAAMVVSPPGPGPCDEPLRIVIAGHVDHGKSTLIGRLFFDTGSLPEERYREIRETCARQGRDFEFAYLTDALEEERLHNVTIDTAQSFFRSARRPYVIIDAPGHREFLKNMITGAAAADAAVLLVDASEGLKEQTRRHAYVLSLLGIDQVVVAINKCDLVEYREDRYRQVAAEVTSFLDAVGISPAFLVPCSAREGDNVVRSSSRMPWYAGPTVLEALDTFEPRGDDASLPFRFPVQDVYVWDRKRIYVGRVETGTVRRGDPVFLSPSGKRSRVASIERFGVPDARVAGPGECVGLTLTDDLFVERGEVVAGEPPPAVATEIGVSLFWLGRRPFRLDGRYGLKLATASAEARVTAIEERIDSSTLEVLERYAEAVEATEVANVVLALDRPLAAEGFEANARLGRIVLTDEGMVAGGGIIRRLRGDSPGQERRVVRLDSRLCTEPDGNLVDLTFEKGTVELQASTEFLARLAHGERVLFRLRGPRHVDVLARFAYQHHLGFTFSRCGDGATAILFGEGRPLPTPSSLPPSSGGFGL